MGPWTHTMEGTPQCLSLRRSVHLLFKPSIAPASASEDLPTCLTAAAALRSLGWRQGQRRCWFCDLGEHGVWMFQAHICKELRQPPAKTQEPISRSVPGFTARSMQAMQAQVRWIQKRGCNTRGMFYCCIGLATQESPLLGGAHSSVSPLRGAMAVLRAL